MDKLNEADKELDDLFNDILSVDDWVYENCPFPESSINFENTKSLRLKDLKASMEAWLDRAVRASQENAVAWTIGVIDDMHTNELYDHQVGNGSVGDRGYKGIKNTIRDRYKSETGVDPAPSYPIKAALTAEPKEEV